MLDTSTPAGSRAAQRLVEEKVAWLTTVRPGGRPQTSPVWFLYRDGEFLVFSKAGTARTSNIESNPRVSVNLDGNGRGGDIVIVEGIAAIDTAAPPSTDVGPYQDKYAGLIERNGWTPESFARDYPVPIRVRPTRFRVW
jgi:PPOX class probable F420-dependent enzyme